MAVKVLRATEHSSPSERGAPRATRVLSGAEVVARNRAEQIVAAAESAAQARIKSAAIEATEVRRLAQKRADEAVAQQLVQAESIARRIVADARDGLAEVARAIAERLLDKEVALNEDVRNQLVRSVLEQVPTGGQIVVRVPPTCVVSTNAMLGEEKWQGCWSAWEVIPDEEMQAGDCTVEAKGGVVDGRVKTRLEALSQALRLRT